MKNPRALISAFCAAHAQHNAGPGAWWEYSQCDAPDLRELFEATTSSRESSTAESAMSKPKTLLHGGSGFSLAV